MPSLFKEKTCFNIKRNEENVRGKVIVASVEATCWFETSQNDNEN